MSSSKQVQGELSVRFRYPIRYPTVLRAVSQSCLFEIHPDNGLVSVRYATKLAGKARVAVASSLALALIMCFAALLRLVPVRVLLRCWGEPLASTGELPIADAWQQGRAKAIRIVVERAAALSPFRADCLPQALVAVIFARWRGIPAAAYLGGRLGAKGKFQAHAWVVSGSVVICGAAGRASYRPLARFLVNSAANSAGFT